MVSLRIGRVGWPVMVNKLQSGSSQFLKDRSRSSYSFYCLLWRGAWMDRWQKDEWEKKKKPQKKQTAKVFSTHTLTSRGISDANSVQESQQCLLGSLSAVPVGVHRGDIYATPLFCLSITHNLCIVALEMHTPTQDAISHVGKVNECQAKVRQCRRCSLSVSSRWETNVCSSPASKLRTLGLIFVLQKSASTFCQAQKCSHSQFLDWCYPHILADC